MIKMNDGEVWRSYPEFPFIEGSTLGRVRTTDRYIKTKNGKRLIKGRILKQFHNRGGYLYVHFSLNGKTVNRYVHRIITSCFLTNPDNWLEVNHKDNNPLNNNVVNLEWCTPEYNIEYREKYGISAKEAARAKRKPLIAFNLRTSEMLWFQSQNEAGRFLGADQGGISAVIKGKCKQFGGYWFTNADKDAVEDVETKFGDKVAREVEQLISKKEL